MSDPDFWDFILEGGDELINSEACQHCGSVIYLDQHIEWIDEVNKIVKCPKCGKQVQING
jgi:NAD-dependent SIR2 family protein deacetylase